MNLYKLISSWFALLKSREFEYQKRGETRVSLYLLSNCDLLQQQHGTWRKKMCVQIWLVVKGENRDWGGVTCGLHEYSIYVSRFQIDRDRHAIIVHITQTASAIFCPLTTPNFECHVFFFLLKNLHAQHDVATKSCMSVHTQASRETLHDREERH